MFTKLCSYLGAIAFTVLTALAGHVYYENNKVVIPPTLEQQLSSVVSIYSMSGTAYCSGWVLKGSNQVITAAHCAGDNMVDPLFVDFGDGKMHPFHVQHIGDKTFAKGPDLMTLTTSDDTIKWPVGLSVCTFKPYYGEQLNLMGGPLGYEKTISFGSVSKPDRSFTDHLSLGSFANDLIQYDGQLLPGNSGGPALDAHTGCVLGSAEFIVPADSMFPFPYGLNFLTPVSDLGALH